ncbi:MAG: 2OG-Fe(II) oxygenase [Candidatus Sericytochromatia bacterium]
MNAESDTTSAPPKGSYLTRFVHIPDVFTPAECRRIVYANLPVSQAHVAYYSGNTQNLLELKQRNTKVKAMPRSESSFYWVYERLIQHIREVNQTYYGFELVTLTNLQVLEYENTGFYQTHVDIGTGETSRRKLSLVLFLTPPEEYEGGQLVLKPRFEPILPQQGSLVIFPSYIPHEVRPVTKGVRHSLVTWILGPCFT